ncbi:MAG: serine/threonine protein kinase [Marmoricola sp.]|nr:serine/threonine protein kinase [Marmoricola sp.]
MSIDQSTRLDDRYRLDERIGTGGTADVWRATDELLNREVAVKVLREVSDPTQRTRFVGEARTLAGLNHPNLVVLLDAGILGERPYLVMPLADDATLASRIALGPMESAIVESIGAQIARALAYAHERGVLHRDVKPSNVLLCGDGRALLADFGIARLVGSTEHHTRTGDAIGSPAYLAPEQVAGEELTTALDVYSLGLVLLEALTAERAFSGTPVEAAVARLNAAPQMPMTLEPGLRALLTRMTQRNAQERPTAHEVATTLQGTDPHASLADRSPARSDPDPEATGSMPLGETTAEFALPSGAPFHSAGQVGQSTEFRADPVVRRRRRSKTAAGLGLAAMALVVTAIVLRPVDGSANPHDPGVPASVPTKYQPSLSDLHAAVNGPAR